VLSSRSVEDRGEAVVCPAVATSPRPELIPPLRIVANRRQPGEGRRAGAPNLHRAPGNVAEAEACFTKALDVARARQSRSLELRAAVSLARLWQGRGKTEEDHDLLNPVYDWFTEGFDTKDLKTLRHCWTSRNRPPCPALRWSGSGHEQTFWA